MTEKKTPTYLAELNSHPRDENIQFDEGPHIYTVNGEQDYTSVTTFIHGLFSRFDSEKIVEGILKKPDMNNPDYEYYGMTKQQILDSWETNRVLSSNAGTQTHYNIECFYNNMEIVDDSVEFEYFKRFVNDYPQYKAFRTEWCVYYEEVKLSGSIDMVFQNTETGEYFICDWKRSKEIKMRSYYGQYAIVECISHIHDSNFWHYSIQLNIYRKILQDKYNMKISGLFLVVLHPNNTTYEMFKVNMMDNTIDKLWNYRKQTLENPSLIKNH